ncbi:MAG: hypothetical protein ABSD29_03610 [Verrucomicrobiota bacterium]|jgi:hypothetical protein
MNQLERNHIESNRPPEPPADTPDGSSLNDLRRQAAALHAAADAAIQNALSSNSQAFNASMRQEGGQ